MNNMGDSFMGCFKAVHISFRDNLAHCTEVHFTSFFSGGFTAMAVINPTEKKLAKRISVHCKAH